MTAKRLTGTKEWAEHSVNCYLGCPHNCRYCYAREAAVRRGLVKWEDWQRPVLRPKAVSRAYPKFPGRVMFPTTHDITPETFHACDRVLLSLVNAGNDVLVVTKPHWSCIRSLTAAYRPLELSFRLTIGCEEPEWLAYWEPGAPAFPERFACLAHLHSKGFRVGVSIEPCLDVGRTVNLVKLLRPLVSDTIWVGLMNRTKARVRVLDAKDRRRLDYVLAGQTRERVWDVYDALRTDPLVRWKDSVRRLLCLPAATEPE